MELLQCVNSASGQNYKRAYHSEDREVATAAATGATTSSSSKTPRSGGTTSVRSATLSGGERRVSLPTGHHYTSSTMGRTTATTSQEQPSKFRYYGSSLSLADEHGTHELTSRTLRPPSPTTLRKSSTTLPPAAAMAAKVERSPNPSLPQMRVELESPKLADYLERPRLVSASASSAAVRNEAVAAAASAHHAKRYENNAAAYRNLRLGNFLEEQDEQENEDNDIIPARLRQYYLDTYLSSCTTCDSQTHCNPLSPIHRGM